MAKAAASSALCLALLLSACNAMETAHNIYRQQHTELHRATITPYVGHAYWTAGLSRMPVCQDPEYLDAALEKGCTQARGHFVIDSYYGAVQAHMGIDDMRVHVTFDDGTAGYTGFRIDRDLNSYFVAGDPLHDPSAYPAFFKDLKPEESARRIKLPGVLTGMSQAEVLASAWGAPSSKSNEDVCDYYRTSEYDDAIELRCTDRLEVWHYAQGASIAFRSGVVAFIQR